MAQACFLTSSLLSSVGVKHGFFMRDGGQGGMSTGDYATLNMSYAAGDDKAHVTENRRRALRALGLRDCPLLVPRQVHSNKVVVVSAGEGDTASDEGADGLVSGVSGYALGVLSADCAPLLCVDVENKVFGVFHVGWRGARDGIVQQGIKTMGACGARPETLRAAIGPCIQKGSYHVGEDMRHNFGEAQDYFAETNGQWTFDLSGFIEARLRQCGVSNVERLPDDTYSDEQRFFSYRRACKQGVDVYGRQLSVMACVL